MVAVALLDREGPCSHCGKDAVLQHDTFFYCRRCYLQVIEHRVKKALHGRLARDKSVHADSAMALYYAKRLYPAFTYTESGGDIRLLSHTMDDELELWRERLFDGPIEVPDEDPGIVKTFLYVTDEELAMAARLLDIPWEPQGKEPWLDDLDRKFRGVKPTFLHNAAELTKALRKP